MLVRSRSWIPTSANSGRLLPFACSDRMLPQVRSASSSQAAEYSLQNQITLINFNETVAATKEIMKQREYPEHASEISKN